jgi:protein-tyrosine-phosphatase
VSPPTSLFDVQRARHMIEHAHARRVDGSVRLTALSIDDPFGRPRRVYEQIARQIDAHIASLAVALLSGAELRHVI